MAAPIISFATLPGNGGSPIDVAKVVNEAKAGKLNCTTEVTLTANAATTTFDHPLIGSYSVILFEPRSANAKSEGTPWVSAKGDRTCTLNHANAASADRTYGVAIFG